MDSMVCGERRLIGVALGVNINTLNTDTAIPLILLAGANFVVRDFYVNNAVINNTGTITNSVTTATGGLFTAAAGGGTALVSNAALSGLTAATGAGGNLSMTIATTGFMANQTTQANVLYFRCGTAQGASTSAVVDCYVWADVFP